MTENRKSLIEVVNLADEDLDQTIEMNKADELTRYRTLVNFNTFLYYALYITDGKSPDEIQLDDKKLQQSFAANKRDKKWILKFGSNLLQLKFIFDNLIIRNSLETNTRRREGDWFLQKAYRIDQNEKSRGHLYVQTIFDKNSFAIKNEDILMIQSMFAVTFTANKDTRWLYSTLLYLFENSLRLNDFHFGEDFLNFLEQLSRDYSNDRFCENFAKKKERFRYDQGVPVFAFNITDYVLWKNRTELKQEYPTVAFDKFCFRNRKSIEHWYPQNSDGGQYIEESSKMSNYQLHSFGNLAILSASQNSKSSNLPPSLKARKKMSFSNQSIKLQMMVEKTLKWDDWDYSKKTEIEEFEDDIIKLLDIYLKG